MHRNSNLRSVRELLSTNFHVTSVDENISCVEIALVSCIGWMWSEQELALNQKETKLRNFVDIDQE